MLSKAYVILAHTNKEQLTRLISRLSDQFSYFFIHIDKNAPLNKESELFQRMKNVVVLNSVETQWGSMGLVAATLNAMKYIREHHSYVERIILLSGQDYPIKSNRQINDFFFNSEYRVFLDYFLLPNFQKWNLDGGAYRFRKYFFGLSFPDKIKAKFLNFSSTFFKVFERRLHHPLQHFYGSQWWIIDSLALAYVLDYLDRYPSYYAFHQYTFAPDELFFQTIILNSRNETILGSIENNNYRFMKWEQSSSAHPSVLNTADFGEISKSAALFARKFDQEVDMEILDLIDKKLLIN